VYEVHLIRAVSLPFINYTYVIVDNSTQMAAVVDPAWDDRAITSYLDERHLSLQAIFLTHSHFDHVNLVDPLVARYHPRVYISRTERDFYGFECAAAVPFDDLAVLNLGETSVTCLLTPGHTAGSACFLLPGALFTGDTLFFEGCGVCTDAGASAYDMFDSLEKLKRRVTPGVAVYPGHSYGQPPGALFSEVMAHNIYCHLDRERFVAFRTRTMQRGLYEFR
jgi:hydroxyacylglutathione hydrolase